MSRQFDGLDDVITCDNLNDILTENGACSLSVWVVAFSSGEGGIGSIISRGVVGTSGVLLRMTSTMGVRFNILSGAATLGRTTADNSIVAGIPAHIGVLWDGTNDFNKIRIFINGIEPTYSAGTNGTAPADTATTTTRIGNRSDGTATFDGTISQLQVFNVELTQGEIMSLMYEPGSVTRGLRRYWPLYGDQSPEPNMAGVGGLVTFGVVTGAVKSSEPPIGRHHKFRRRRIHYFTRSAGLVLSETSNVPGSRNFNGTTDNLSYLSVAHTVMSACAWVYVDASGNSDFPRIFDSPAYQFYFGKDTSVPLAGDDNTLKLSSVRTVDGVWNTPQSSHANGRWVHCAVAYDSAATTNVPFMWLDGVFQTVANQVPAVGAQVSNAGNGLIGNNGAGTRAIDGKIAHLMIFNRMLTDGEVKQCMRVPGSLTNGLLYYWPMFGDASPEPELSSFHYNATVGGTGKFNGPPIARHNRLVRRAIPTAYRKKFNYAINETLTITLTEAQSKDVLKVLLQSLTLAHPVFSPSKDTLKGIVQALTLSESMQKDIIKSLTQSITLTESQAKDFLKVLINNMSLTESHGKDTLHSILEALTVTESLSKDTLKAISQSITLTESHSLTIIGTVLDLIEFLVHGNIETHDKIAMIRDLITTALNKSDFDMMENDLVLTGRPKIDDDTQETDEKKLLCDWHSN